MTPFTLGQRVEWKQENGTRIFRGWLMGWSPDKYYAWTLMEQEAKSKIVRGSRLQHPTGAGLWRV